MVDHITQEEFEQRVVSSEKPVFVDFYASWCGPCKMFAPVFERVASDVQEADFFKVDVDDQPELASQFGVRSIPTLIAFSQGKPVATKNGMMPEAMFRSFVSEIVQ